MSIYEARKDARAAKVDIGKLTTEKDSQGEYTLYEDGSVVAEGFYDNASDIKEDYIIEQTFNKACGGFR